MPEVVVKRLPAYLRVLEELDEEEIPIVSSQELGRRAGVSPGQVRKDLTNFGVFGKQGVGYQTAVLRRELRRILGLDRPIPVGLIGAGHLGLAVARYDQERERSHAGGTYLVAIFDKDPRKIGTSIGNLVIRDVGELEETIAALGIKIVIVAVPAPEAQRIVERAICAGVRAFLNFAPVNLVVPPGVVVHTTDVGLELEALAYYA
ncbi:MAG: redox-sensing transcriptional repressor Rex [Firmicutes bacterium]|nr:redox-sensing transcriptional repressor Rex [Bacillota bacterium]